MDKLANMQTFEIIGRTGSFAEAARKLNLANSVVSKRVKDLEDFLGVQLLVRTTRKVKLTDAGHTYLDYVQKFLDELNELENRIRFQVEKPVGTIKLAAPLSFGVQYLGAAITPYLHRNPEVTIKTYLSDRNIDLIDEGYDLAIRSGPLKDSSLISKKLVSCRRVVCASPEYFAQHGKPQTPNDLKDHKCLSYLNLADGKAWPFKFDNQIQWQPVTGSFFSDNGDLLHEAALSGCGITLLPTFIVGESIKSGKLEVILEEFEQKDFDIYIVYQYARHLPVKIRTLIDHLASHFQERSFKKL